MKRKIVYFHPQNDYTGSTRILANILEGQGYEPVYVVTHDSGDGFLSNMENVRILPLVIKGKYGFDSLTWRLSLIFWSIYCLFRFDTYYINTIQPYYAALIGRVFRKNIVYHVHEKYSITSHTTRMAEKVFNRIDCQKIFVSNYVKEQYPCHTSKKAIVRYNKLSPEFLKRVKIKPIEERTRKNILMISSLTKAKGVDVFVDIASMLPEYNFILVLSTTKKDIHDFFGDIKSGNITIYSKQSDITPFLYDADIILNLSNPFFWVETFGMTILEAMAFQVPAIVPNVGGPLELVEDGKNGYAVDVTDKELLCDTIRKSMEKNNYKRLCMGTIEKYTEINNHE